ncbi:MAG: hypothetical protein WA364_30280, partial [Candidatus Nitrosopolaris sp.]
MSLLCSTVLISSILIFPNTSGIRTKQALAQSNEEIPNLTLAKASMLNPGSLVVTGLRDTAVTVPADTNICYLNKDLTYTSNAKYRLTGQGQFNIIKDNNKSAYGSLIVYRLVGKFTEGWSDTNVNSYNGDYNQDCPLGQVNLGHQRTGHYNGPIYGEVSIVCCPNKIVSINFFGKPGIGEEKEEFDSYNPRIHCSNIGYDKPDPRCDGPKTSKTTRQTDGPSELATDYCGYGGLIRKDNKYVTVQADGRRCEIYLPLTSNPPPPKEDCNNIDDSVRSYKVGPWKLNYQIIRGQGLV